MKFMLLLIRVYQSVSRALVTHGLFSPISGCRQWPTCSEYAVHAIQTRGAVAGTAAALKRFARCNPLTPPVIHVH